VKIQPVISTTALTCVTTAGSKTVTSSAAFGSVLADQAIQGAGIPWGTTVLSKETSSSITISNPASATSASVSLRFGYFTSLAYADEDALGFPFELPFKKINNIMVIDAAKQITALELAFFRKPFVPSADNAAFAPSDADMAELMGFLVLDGTKVYGDNQIVYYDAGPLQLPLDVGGKTYVQLIAQGAATFLTVSDLTLNISGE